MIINPMIFYWISIASAVKNIFEGIAITSLIIVAVFLAVLAGIALPECKIPSAFEPYKKGVKKWIKVTIVTGIVSLIFMIAIPSEKTCTKMLIASQVTTDNIELVEGEIQKATDYVVEKIQEAKK